MPRKQNPWISFVQQHKGQGLTMKQLSVIYQEQKGNEFAVKLRKIDDQADNLYKQAERLRKNASLDIKKKTTIPSGDKELQLLRLKLKECEERLKKNEENEKQRMINLKKRLEKQASTIKSNTSWSS